MWPDEVSSTVLARSMSGLGVRLEEDLSISIWQRMYHLAQVSQVWTLTFIQIDTDEGVQKMWFLVKSLRENQNNAEHGAREKGERLYLVRP